MARLIRRILVVKLADLGDALTATPAIRALRQAFPQARLDVLASPQTAAIFQRLPWVDRVSLFPTFRYRSLRGAFNLLSLAEAARTARELRLQCYDAVTLLHHLTTRRGTLKYAALALASGAEIRAGLDNGRGWFLTHRVEDRGFGHMHEIAYCLQVVGLLGGATDNFQLEMPVLDQERAWAMERLPGAGPWVAIHPGSGAFSLARRWPPQCFAAVADALAGRGWNIVLVGGREEVEAGKLVQGAMSHPARNLIGQTALGQLAAVLERAAIFVGGDSGVMHMAVAVKTPVVAIFGPSNHRAWGPYPFLENPVGYVRRGTNIVVRSDLPCSPCLYREHSLGLREGCPERPCMTTITPQEVLEAVDSLADVGRWRG